MGGIVQAAQVGVCLVENGNPSVESPGAFAFTEDPFLAERVPSKQYCENLRWVEREVKILSLGFSAVSIACLGIPEPFSKPISAVLLISNFGLQTLSFSIQGDLDSCDKQEQEKQVRKILGEYLTSKGAIISEEVK